ncbi:MAG: condensation domain-containing protein, partial [Nitrosospira sp.]|nr:condensation domain-containing protein [Nitrosospira sp.]
MEKLKANGLDFAELPIVPADRSRALPLSYVQRGLWLTWRMDPASPAYNIPGVLHLKGKLDIAALQKSLDDLIVRHETLRTIFRLGDSGEPEQVVHSEFAGVLPTSDLRGVPDDLREAEAYSLVQAFAEMPFKLDREMPFRAALFQIADDEYRLALAVHHIAADGWSLNILIDELAAFYEAHTTDRIVSLPPLPIQFADYAVWQRNWLEAGEKEKQFTYWRTRLGTEHPVLSLPTDRPRSVANGSREGRYAFILPADLSDRLRAIGRTHGASLYMVMLSLLKLMLYRFTGQDDLRIGSPIANRQRAETHLLVGYLTNMQVLRTQLDATKGFAHLLARVRDTVLSA